MCRATGLSGALIVPITVVVLWEGVSTLGLVPPHLLPAPHEVLTALWSIREVVPTLCRVVLATAGRGLLLGGLAGVAVGLVFGCSQWARERFLFTLDVLRLIPAVALVPLVWSSIGIVMTRLDILMVALGVFPVVGIRTVAMLRSVDPTIPLPAVARGGSPSRIDRAAVMPDMIVHFLDVVRLAVATALALGVAFHVVVFLGARISIPGSATAVLMAALVVFAAITIGSDLLLRAVVRTATSWRQHQSDRSALLTASSEVVETGGVEELAATPANHSVESDRNVMLHRLGLLLAVLIVWLWATGRGHVDPFLLPSPWDLVELLGSGGGYLPDADGPFVAALLAAAWTTVRGSCSAC